MNKVRKIDCYCFLYSRKGMCAAHTLKEIYEELKKNDSSRWRRLFGLSKENQARLKRLERAIYKQEGNK